MKIAPSILDSNYGNLQADIDSIHTADRVHLDIMDGHYVPNLSFGASILKKVNFPAPTEAHLMVERPEDYFDSFQDLGCIGITFHIEATGIPKAIELLKDLRSRGLKSGISIDGYTESQWLTDEILGLSDQVLVMSVKSGFGGQSFLPAALEKIKELRARGYKGEIEVDGGVNLDNIADISAAGADIVVVGSFLMKKAPEDRAKLIEQFQSA